MVSEMLPRVSGKCLNVIFCAYLRPNVKTCSDIGFVFESNNTDCFIFKSMQIKDRKMNPYCPPANS